MRALYQWDPSESSLRNSPLGNKKKKIMLLRGEKILKPIKILRIFLLVGLSQDPKGEDLLRVSIMFESFKETIHLKVSLKRPKTIPNYFWTSPKQLSKSPKNDFFGPQNGQITGTNIDKSVDFWVYFWPKSPNIASKELKPVLKSFPLYARYLTTLKTWKKNGPDMVQSAKR